MGLMDVLRGMQYGPHGPPRSGTGTGTGTGTGSGSGMSPITMAILGLLAYKALKSMTRHDQPAPAGGGPLPPGSGNGGNIAARDMREIEARGGMPGRGDVRQLGAPGSEMSGSGPDQGQAGQGTGEGSEPSGGNVSDLIKGALGSLLAGTAAGGVMSGGLNDFLKQLQKHGFSDAADSWVGPGPNKTIPPGDLAKVLGAEQIDAMMEHSGLSRDELLEGLSRNLPEVIDQLTPEGKVPTRIPM
jgi:uncharacterized protein YidB (DUF937 family)